VRFPPVERPDHVKRPLDGAPGQPDPVAVEPLERAVVVLHHHEEVIHVDLRIVFVHHPVPEIRIAGILAALILVPALWMWRDILVSPQTMIPALIGVPLFAGVVWCGWGRKSENWSIYAVFLAAALALPVGALAYLVIGWIPVALGVKPIVVGAAFWTGSALAILRQIALQRQKREG